MVLSTTDKISLVDIAAEFSDRNIETFIGFPFFEIIGKPYKSFYVSWTVFPIV